MQIVQRTGERWFEAELYRQEGQLLLRQGHTEAAEGLYCEALSIAREQEAKVGIALRGEPRAAAPLPRLPSRSARSLAPVYGWFNEGFSTPDLKEAKALLDELESA